MENFKVWDKALEDHVQAPVDKAVEKPCDLLKPAEEDMEALNKKVD